MSDTKVLEKLIIHLNQTINTYNEQLLNPQGKLYKEDVEELTNIIVVYGEILELIKDLRKGEE